MNNSSAWRWALALARMSVGPLAMVAFFLPWAHGPGPLSATEFTGFTLVGYAGRLRALDLTLVQGGFLWFVRLLILGVAVAAAWQIVLAPRARGHVVYPVSGWYIVVLAILTLAIGLARSGVTPPPLGLGLLGLAGLVFLACELARLGGALRSCGSSPRDPASAAARFAVLPKE